MQDFKLYNADCFDMMDDLLNKHPNGLFDCIWTDPPYFLSKQQGYQIVQNNDTGSVDEKLQTCDFKKKQYKKLLSQINIDVEYIYLLSDWFKKPEYKDVLDYIISVGCSYYFNYIPLDKLNLPVS